jgi:hypothetical protein
MKALHVKKRVTKRTRSAAETIPKKVEREKHLHDLSD